MECVAADVERKDWHVCEMEENIYNVLACHEPHVIRRVRRLLLNDSLNRCQNFVFVSEWIGGFALNARAYHCRDLQAD